MVMRRDRIAELSRLAALKSDLELKRFAAFRVNVEAARQRIAQQDAAIEQFYRVDAPLSLTEARLASLEVAETARDAARARRDLAQMLPRFERARQRAAREFGRADVLRRLSQDDRF